ncbi:hypothetical protein C2G38_2036515 [Gigaspora rosea]|uniref:Uncharacterized protein n=1 Tax=Gigaspora rosea TaxID=44941 RepID=A0A397V910_9GLOM|nr:hypothetical protein C2G38_2036515 [Gigaspora rosea]
MPKHKEYTILLLSRVTLKAHEFITKVVQSNSAFGPCPEYICKCGNIQSDICETATVAISSVYHQVFKTKTKFSGLEVLGFDKTIITDELLSDLPFRPYNFQLGILRIWIVKIGCSNEITTNLAGPGFKSAFIYQYNKSRALFFQEIDKNHCRVTIYYECNAYIDFIEQNPDLVWSKIGILQKYNRNQLFELTNQYTTNLIQAAQIPYCTLNEWNNKEIITNIYNYHLKCCIIANINWYQFFCNKFEQPNTIIELRSALQLIYPIEHEIGERKFRAWKAMLKNVGCSDITPYEKDQSNVLNNLIRACMHLWTQRISY